MVNTFHTNVNRFNVLLAQEQKKISSLLSFWIARTATLLDINHIWAS